MEDIIVVGATGEIGSEIVKRLINRYRIIAVARSSESLIAAKESLGNPINFVPCVADISNDNAINVIQESIKGEVRAVIHGPGVPTAGGVLEAPTEALIEATNIKVGGMIRLIRAADPSLIKHSRLIAIGGHYGFEPTAYTAAAGIANAALVNLMKQYSWAMGPRGITSHVVAPGPADTERLRRVANAKATQENKNIENVLSSMREESAIGEFTGTNQVAWAIEMLLAEEADALAGSTLFMDAGRRKST
ncbi:SDR family oxidoreductase [Zhongshania marina]|uniref:Short-chain dehydrogenase n=1 Tax=Zhongshania marina TaxID=2304603 RepID=A0A2S4HKG2_9GAMM|nr:SDR family oxidoreductase [Marortus luteolus]POP54484.1 short-chain dehydrogenase [Marortus luteolus]